jgi:hypothetical protein
MRFNMKNMTKLLMPAMAAFVMTAAMPNAGKAQGCIPVGSYKVTNGTQILSVTAKADTLTYGGTTADTFTLKLTCKPQSITFQEDITKIAGRIDSLKIYVWASADNGLNYVQLNTQTSTNASGAIQYVVQNSSGYNAGNPFTNYMVTASLNNTAAGSSASWKGYLLIR